MISNSGTFTLLARSFNIKANAGVMAEWIIHAFCNPLTINPATGVRSAESALRFLPALLLLRS